MDSSGDDAKLVDDVLERIAVKFDNLNKNLLVKPATKITDFNLITYDNSIER